MEDPDRLAAWLHAALDAPRAVSDLDTRLAGVTPRDAYRIQRLIVDRRVAAGDRVIGYKAALTSPAMQAQTGIGEPMLGTLLASRRFEEDEPVSLSRAGFLRATLEPEIAVVLGRDLQGPGLASADVPGAVAGYLPAIELGDYRIDGEMRSLQAGVVCNTFSGGIVLGRPLTAPHGLDLRYEGMAMHVNGKPAGSGTGVEVLGDPLASVAFCANTLATLGLSLRAGMVLMTGSIVASIPLAAGDHVQVGFSRLGRVEVRIEP